MAALWGRIITAAIITIHLYLLPLSIGLVHPSRKSIIQTHVTRNDDGSTYSRGRRDFFHLVTSSAIISIQTLNNPKSSIAANLPVSNGANLSKTGTIEKLIPIVNLKQSLQNAKVILTQPTPNNDLSTDVLKEVQSRLETIPSEEKNFKRYFDEYSDPVSYKQKYMDKNAFLVYYTEGFDGVGRDSIESGEIPRQTLQYGARNECWNAFEELIVEVKFAIKDGSSSRDDILGLLTKTIVAFDSYLSIAPKSDVDKARVLILKRLRTHEQNCQMEYNQVEDILSILENVCGAIEPKERNDQDIYSLARKGDTKRLRAHLESTADINKRDLLRFGGRSVLQEASFFNNNETVEAILGFSEHSLDVNQGSFLGKDTALHFAIANCNKDVAFNLLQHGADPNKRNKYGETPLHLCTDKGVASLLVTFGASVTCKDKKLRTPIEHALSRGYDNNSDVFKFLVEIQDSARINK